MSADVALSLRGTAEGIAVVRAALAGLVEVIGIDALEAGDLDTAVTEAARNVVYHAYDGVEGPLEVELRALAGAVEAVVRDRGLGIRPHLGERTQPHTGIGLPIIHALSEVVTFSKLAGGGTEVRMLLAAPGASAIAPGASAIEPPAAGAAGRYADEQAPSPASDAGTGAAPAVAAALRTGRVADAVLPRVLGTLAGGLALTAERVSEVERLADALAAGARSGGESRRLHLAADRTDARLELRIGPYPAGSAGALLEQGAAVASALAGLSGDGRVLASGRGEELSVSIPARA